MIDVIDLQLRFKLLELATRHGLPANKGGPAQAAIEVVEAWERWIDAAQVPTPVDAVGPSSAASKGKLSLPKQLR